MKTLSLKIPEWLDQRIAYEISQRRIPKSAFVREALDAFLSNGGVSKKRPSVLDLTRDLAGKYGGGPKDLSTNPKYLDGFGK